jgi:predicted nucleotidyltransferase
LNWIERCWAANALSEKIGIEHHLPSWYMWGMIDEHDIRRVARRMGIAANADRVILFGCYARGEATENSDVDLLIVAESGLPRFKRSRELYKLMRPYPFGMDLVVYTPQEIERGKKSAASFVSTVLREGKTLSVRGDRDSETVAGQGQE